MPLLPALAEPATTRWRCERPRFQSAFEIRDERNFVVGWFYRAEQGDLAALAPEMLELLVQLRDEWFEPHYGQNDVGMAALLRDKIRALILKAGARP